MKFQKGNKAGIQFSKEYQPKKHRGKRVGTILNKLLEMDSGIDGLTNAELIARNLILSALGRNPEFNLKAAKEVMDRTEGKSTQTTITKEADPLDNMSKEELTELLETLKNIDSKVFSHDKKG